MLTLPRRDIKRLVSLTRRYSDFLDVQSEYSKYVLYTYDRFPIDIDSGEGSYFFDRSGKEYLDFGSGIAVNALGYNHPVWVEAVKRQASKLCHVSNLFYTSEQLHLAKQLVGSCCSDRAFFCNSGAEANEAAIKFSRRYARNLHQREDKTTVVAFEGSFHGRTLGSLSLTSNKNYREPFEPLLPGTKFGQFNNVDAVDELIDDSVCGVLVEPIQGEGGVIPANADFLQALRRRTEEVGALLMLDEVQCGFGRTGRLWAHELYGVEPDLITMAKPLAGGLPIGAVLCKAEVGDQIKPGDHGTTFGGNALICAVASAMFDVINQPDFLRHVDEMGQELSRQIHEKIAPMEVFKEVRHCGGLMCGVELTIPVKDVLANCREEGVVILSAGPNVLRMVPPLIVGKREITKAIDVLAKSIEVAMEEETKIERTD